VVRVKSSLILLESEECVKQLHIDTQIIRLSNVRQNTQTDGA